MEKVWNIKKQFHVNFYISVVLVVDAVAQIRGRDATAEEESEIVRSVRQKLQFATREEARQIKELAELKERGIELVSVQQGSIRLYFWRRTQQGLQRLLEWLDSGYLHTVVENIVGAIKDEPLSIKYLWIRDGVRVNTPFSTSGIGKLKF